MKVLIQQNWTSGLGDLYIGACEYLNFVKRLKDLGYETELNFSYNGFTGGNKFIGPNPFETIFDIKSFDVFDKITISEYPIGEKNYNNLIYNHTQYGPNSPGIHWWDCWFDVVPDINIYPNFSPYTLLSGEQIPSILPKFNEEVYKRSNKFVSTIGEGYNFIQIRYFDYNFKSEDITSSVSKLYDAIEISDQKFHIGSNNQYSINTLKILPNVTTYEFNNLDLFPNDHTYYFYNKHISNDILLDRLYDNISEMVSIENAKKIYQLTYYSWISNFVYYGLSNRENKNIFFNINENNIIF